MKNISNYLEEIFENRRQTAISLREYFNCTQTAALMGISRRAVWMHCTSHAKKNFIDRHLTDTKIEKIKQIAQ